MFHGAKVVLWVALWVPGWIFSIDNGADDHPYVDRVRCLLSRLFRPKSKRNGIASW
ncbi:MAG: hypothetical protein ACI9ON_000592 [Limisphaerales bacterium]|jgi:hypothetical protein